MKQKQRKTKQENKKKQTNKKKQAKKQNKAKTKDKNKTHKIIKNKIKTYFEWNHFRQFSSINLNKQFSFLHRLYVSLIPTFWLWPTAFICLTDRHFVLL